MTLSTVPHADRPSNARDMARKRQAFQRALQRSLMKHVPDVSESRAREWSHCEEYTPAMREEVTDEQPREQDRAG